MIYLLLLLFLYVVYGGDPPCTGRDQCSCVTADNKVIDLTSVGRTDGTPVFKDLQAPDGYMYSYNPCYAFAELACTDQSACQIPTDRSTSYPAGDASSAVFSNDGLNNHIIYTSTDSVGTTRSTDVTLVCDTGGGDASLTPVGEQGSSTYFLTLTTKCACPDGCVKSKPTEKPHPGDNIGGLSIGSILCICVLCLLVVYLIGGMLFMRIQRQASGREMIPNSAFWASIPGHVKAGFQFMFSKLRGKNTTPTYSSI